MSENFVPETEKSSINTPVAVSINKIKVIKKPYLGLKEFFGRRFEIIDEGVSDLFA